MAQVCALADLLIGPLADLIGLDALLAVMELLHCESKDPRYRPAPLLNEMAAAGKFGRPPSSRSEARRHRAWTPRCSQIARAAFRA
jgi:3-hydroxyacyl-CoA dehydrogenase